MNRTETTEPENFRKKSKFLKEVEKMRLLLASFGLVSAELASFTVEKNEGATFLSKRVRREENFPENLYKLGCP